jgi:adenylate cyclase
MRRFAAIVAGDIYSRLMHNDEEATHDRFTALVANAVMPAIADRLYFFDDRRRNE